MLGATKVESRNTSPDIVYFPTPVPGLSRTNSRFIYRARNRNLVGESGWKTSLVRKSGIENLEIPDPESNPDSEADNFVIIKILTWLTWLKPSKVLSKKFNLEFDMWRLCTRVVFEKVEASIWQAPWMERKSRIEMELSECLENVIHSSSIESSRRLLTFLKIQQFLVNFEISLRECNFRDETCTRHESKIFVSREKFSWWGKNFRCEKKRFVTRKKFSCREKNFRGERKTFRCERKTFRCETKIPKKLTWKHTHE